MRKDLDKVLKGGRPTRSRNSHHQDPGGWREGVGRGLRNAVATEGGETPYEDLDSLPRHESLRKRHVIHAWDRKNASFRWPLLNRWLQAQVGRPMDEIRSEVAKNSRKDTPSDRRMKKDILDDESLMVRTRPEIVTEDDGWFRLVLKTLDGTHIQDRYPQIRDLYVDAKGILRKVPEKLALKVEADNRKRREERHLKVVWLHGAAYFRLNGAWFHLELTKWVPPVGVKPADWYYRYRAPACLLCHKLKLSWRDNAWILFGDSSLYCHAMRTLSRKEARHLMLDVPAA